MKLNFKKLGSFVCTSILAANSLPLNFNVYAGNDDPVAPSAKCCRASSKSADQPIIDQLFDAVKNNQIEIVKELLDRGANVNATDENGNTPLHWAAKNVHTDIVELLIDTYHVDVNIQNEWGNTPLHTAAFYGHPNVVSLLIKKGANVNAQTSGPRLTPLHYVVHSLRLGITVTKWRGLLNATDFINTIRILIENGADINARNALDQTPIDLANELGLPDEIASLLEKQGAQS